MAGWEAVGVGGEDSGCCLGLVSVVGFLVWDRFLIVGCVDCFHRVHNSLGHGFRENMICLIVITLKIQQYFYSVF